ncbi:MAG TPA: CDGSH iron-sulfur domain-containing protein [Mycobacteriales bacterium]|nr:CDGSH iron-sulfur domain-containing protein [Mycobacteriales bacterium]
MSQVDDGAGMTAEISGDLTGLIRAAGGLVMELTRSPLVTLPGAAARLTASVIRPLQDLIPGPVEPLQTSGPVDEQLWQLTQTASALAARPDAPDGLLEAAAALQDLAYRLPDRPDIPPRLAELCGGLATGIRVAPDGPYLAAGAKTVVNHLGEPVQAPPVMAFCRCGESAIKPLCDGSHARIGFTGDKDPGRVPDHRDTYVGVQVTVLDNRGICAHSGLCTDRLSTVFHSGSEPFVTASGGRMDEIIRAARDCPSGALSFAIDGREAREEVDQSLREPTITVTKDGPYRLTGGIPLTTDGADVPRNEGSSREHYSLCRCGQSRNKPFCSGMHYYVNFTDPVLDPDTEPTLFQWAGGFPALLRTSRLFYEKYVPQDPLLAPLFAAMSADHPERVASWLSEVFGGPAFYSEQYGGYSRMISQHLGKMLTEEQRARWVSLLGQSAQEAGLPTDAEFRAAFIAYLEWGSRIALENSQTDATPPPGMPVPRWWWVCNATPGARVSALARDTAEQAPVELPGENEALAFQVHIKPLFRSMDRSSMKFVFDLWEYADVRQHAPAILERLQAGTMPCDGAWPAEKTAVFARWIDTGMAE